MKTRYGEEEEEETFNLPVFNKQKHNNNEYLERLTRTGPKHLHVL